MSLNFIATFASAALIVGVAMSCSAQNATSSDESIPPAVAKQFEAMQKRIEQLEQELRNRPAQSPASAVDGQDGPHTLAEQAPEASIPAGVSPESSLAQQGTAKQKPEPFSFADFTWLNGNSRIKEVPFQTKFFTPEIRVDADYVYSFNHPQDDTISGSSEVFRANEFQVTQWGAGGDFHWNNVQARLLTQFGMYSQTTPRNVATG